MTLDILLTFFLVFLNGFFVAAEFAIVKVRTSQLELRVQEGSSSANLAKHITSHLDGYLAATQLGITLASLGLGWIGESVVSKMIVNLMLSVGVVVSPELAHDVALPVAFVIITFLHIVFGELAPKSIAIQRSVATTIAVAYPLQFFYVIFKPFIWILNGIANLMLRMIGISPLHGTEIHTSAELKYLVAQGKESGTINESEYHIISNAFDFSERMVKQVMVARTQVIGIDLNAINDETIDGIINERYSRFPCFEDNIDNIVGVVYIKDVLLKLKKDKVVDLRKIMRPIMSIPETKRIGQLLQDLQRKHQQIAVVVDEYGGTQGIVTMEDILEELVGDIQDEYDNELPVVEKRGERIYKVVASTVIEDINKLLPHPIEKDAQYDTLAGFLILKFGRIPNVFEKITIEEYEFTILTKRKNSILLVQLKDLTT